MAQNLPIKHHGDRTYGQQPAHRADSFASSTSPEPQTASVTVSPPPPSPSQLSEAENPPKRSIAVDAAESSLERSSSPKSRSAHHKSNSQPVKATATTKPTGKRFSLKQVEKASQEENKKRKRQNPARDFDSKSFAAKEQERLPAPFIGSDGKKSVAAAEEDKQKTDTSSASKEAWSVSHDFGEKTIPTTLATELIRPQQSGSYQFISGPFNTYETATWDREDQREQEERRVPDKSTKR